jgi:hydroxyethylthiazole kinase-like uncharacterized protein yjeF
LSIFKDEPDYLFQMLHGKCVLTPHSGEFDRLFPGLVGKTVNKIEAAISAAKTAGCVVVLKGADTVVADPAGKACVNVQCSPFLSTAGSGDVLSGMIGGWMAQGVPAYESACASVWIHGDASLLGGAGLVSEDLLEYFPRVLTRIYEDIAPNAALWERKIEFTS